MIAIEKVEHIYIACGSTDLRKSIDGYAALVQERFQLSPFSNAIFLFCNKSRNKIKILQWENDGFWLYYKRLEKGTFKWPSKTETMVPIEERQFRWLLEGLKIEQKKAHHQLNFDIVI
jgi:transposase